MFSNDLCTRDHICAYIAYCQDQSCLLIESLNPRRSLRQRYTRRDDYIGAVGRMSETDSAGGPVEPGTAVSGDGEVGLPTSGGGLPAAGVTRPLVLPETFDGSSSWTDWCFHFENVASVNGWDDAQKLKWLRVRMTGRAQKALHRLTGTAIATYEATRDAMKARFEPESRQTRYQAEFQTRRKKPSEGWADFADDLRSLADKAYPTLQEEARERLSINAYLTQLPQPHLAFSVRQKQPTSLDEAVAATIEMESYLVPQATSISSTLPTEDTPAPACSGVESVDKVSQLARVVERLADQVEKLQKKTADVKQGPSQTVARENRWQGEPPRRQRRLFSGECWNCFETGHMARHCPNPRQRQQGN